MTRSALRTLCINRLPTSHPRIEAICGVANPRHSGAMAVVLRLASHSNPRRAIGNRFMQRVPSPEFHQGHVRVGCDAVRWQGCSRALSKLRFIETSFYRNFVLSKLRFQGACGLSARRPMPARLRPDKAPSTAVPGGIARSSNAAWAAKAQFYCNGFLRQDPGVTGAMPRFRGQLRL